MAFLLHASDAELLAPETDLELFEVGMPIWGQYPNSRG